MYACEPERVGCSPLRLDRDCAYVVVSGDRGGSQSSVGRQATSAAESACSSAVNGQYGGDVRSVEVISSEFSQANSLVMVKAVGVRGGSVAKRWRGLVSNDGAVQDLSVARKTRLRLCRDR